MKTTAEKVIALYAVAALIAFGHAAANYDCQPDASEPGNAQAKCIVAKYMVGAVVGLVWPLYLSNVAWGGGKS